MRQLKTHLYSSSITCFLGIAQESGNESPHTDRGKVRLYDQHATTQQVSDADITYEHI